MTVQQDVYDRLVQAYINENLRGAMVVLAFKDPDGTRRLEFIKAFPEGTNVTEVVGLMEMIKTQAIGDETISEWIP